MPTPTEEVGQLLTTIISEEFADFKSKIAHDKGVIAVKVKHKIGKDVDPDKMTADDLDLLENDYRELRVREILGKLETDQI